MRTSDPTCRYNGIGSLNLTNYIVRPAVVQFDDELVWLFLSTKLRFRCPVIHSCASGLHYDSLKMLSLRINS